MANMSARILRNIVSSVFQVKPQQIILSGEIAYDFVAQHDCGHSWWSGASTHNDSVYAFDPKIGFVCIAGENLAEVKDSEYKLLRDYSFSKNGEMDTSEGEPLEDHPQILEFCFFLVHSYGKHYGENGESFNEWKLYSSPNFREIWKKVDEEDIERWENWLNSLNKKG
jgi:hypothetical protein